jgi:hypothetical protein
MSHARLVELVQWITSGNEKVHALKLSGKSFFQQRSP